MGDYVCLSKKIDVFKGVQLFTNVYADLNSHPQSLQMTILC